jgi:WD40 repeat protein
VLACGRRRQAVLVWNVFSGRVLSARAGHESAVRALAFSAAGDRLRSVDQEGALIHWETAGRELSRVETAPERADGEEGVSEPELFAFSPQGRNLAYVPKGERGLTLWEGRRGKELFSMYEDSLLPPSFSGDGSRVAVYATPDLRGQVRLGGPASGAELVSLASPEEVLGSRLPRGGKLPAVVTARSRFSTADERGPIRVWDTASGEVVARLAFPERVLGMQLRPDGKALAVVTDRPRSSAGRVGLYDVSTGRPVAGFKAFLCPVEEKNVLAFSPTGRFLAVTAGGGKVHVRDARSGALLRALSFDELPVTALTFSPDGRVLAIQTAARFDEAASVALWEWPAGRKRWVLPVGGPELTALAFSPDGERFATGHADGSILLWGLRRGSFPHSPRR